MSLLRKYSVMALFKRDRTAAIFGLYVASGTDKRLVERIFFFCFHTGYISKILISYFTVEDLMTISTRDA